MERYRGTKYRSAKVQDKTRDFTGGKGRGTEVQRYKAFRVQKLRDKVQKYRSTEVPTTEFKKMETTRAEVQSSREKCRVTELKIWCDPLNDFSKDDVLGAI